MRKLAFIIGLTCMTLLSLCGCQQEADIFDTEIQASKIIVEKMPMATKTRSKIVTTDNNTKKDAYFIRYNDFYLKNVFLTEDEAAIVRSAISMDTVSITLNDFSEWTWRDTGRTEWYARNFPSNNEAVLYCGIQPGTYFTKDAWFWKTYQHPYDMAIILDEACDYPDYKHMGWKPNEDGSSAILDQFGYRWSLSGSLITLQTAGYVLKYTVSGQELFYTYPFKSSELQWNLKLLVLNI